MASREGMPAGRRRKEEEEGRDNESVENVEDFVALDEIPVPLASVETALPIEMSALPLPSSGRIFERGDNSPHAPTWAVSSTLWLFDSIQSK
ncbi:hypothetical protein CRG98_024826 [Punica granatum]|uniref:Uncharacterized protein n=1 Tax=Punica granatum TaxID=22663 RepID=A0A2I0JEY4_PUNGR|nr:hypothetical protein CRG98_024826 [Punica granatum]